MLHILIPKNNPLMKLTGFAKDTSEKTVRASLANFAGISN